MNLVDRETATGEVEKWLDFKRVRDAKRESSKETIDSLIDAVCSGQLMLNDDMSWTQNLDVEIPGDTPLTTLKYKPRLKVSEVHSKMKGAKSTDVDARIVALVSALTGKNAALISGLDTSDYSIATSIALFFL